MWIVTPRILAAIIAAAVIGGLVLWVLSNAKSGVSGCPGLGCP